jgi:hypothetical protein
MLHKFLSANRSTILDLSREKTNDIAESKPTSKELESGLPEFYDHLIDVLKKQARGGGKINPQHYAPSTTRHGVESLRLGYNVSQVVHSYGVICQAITEMAEKKGAKITPGEFSTLNLSLDVAIAEAVTGFAGEPGKADPSLETNERMGSLVHELRNALACAIVAHSLVKEGVVGTASSTNALLERNLQRMRDLIDRSFSEFRMHKDATADRHPMPLFLAVEEVLATAGGDARAKGVSLMVEVDHHLEVNVDRNYLISALANLVQNAIKFSKRDGTIWVRGVDAGTTVVLQVEDQCGGLPEGKAEELFRPFTQKNNDKTGLGLGLSISRRAVALNDGTLSVRDIPGTGCVFTITLPKIKQPAPVQ